MIEPDPDQDIAQRAAIELTAEDFPARFLKKYLARHGHVQVFGMRRGLPLSKAYVTVTMAAQEAVAQPRTVSGVVEKFARRSNPSGTDPERRRNGMEVANKYPHLVVLGPPGAGKSTFSRRVGLEALSNLDKKKVLGIRGAKFKHKCLPVFVELKRLNPPELTIEMLVADEMKLFSPDPDAWKKLMDAGLVLFLLDGYDEVPANKMELVIPQVRDFVDRNRHNRFIISCRSAVYRTAWLSSFVLVDVNEFDDEQVENYIKSWFRYQVEKAREAKDYVAMGRELWGLLQQEIHAPTLELARTPLLLLFLCLNFLKTQQVASKRSKLYRRALQILIEEWASEKMLHHRRPVGLDFEVEIEILSGIAGPAFKENKLAFSRAELITLIENSLNSRVLTPGFSAQDLFKAVVEEQGLIVQRDEDVFTFSHLTLHEFLAAHYFSKIFTMSEKPERIRGFEMLMGKVLDPKWREIFLLLTGIVDSDSLLEFIAAVPQQLLGRNPRLSKLVSWAESILLPALDESNAAATRAFCLGNIIQCHLVQCFGLAVNPFVVREFNSLRLPDIEKNRHMLSCADSCRTLVRNLDGNGSLVDSNPGENALNSAASSPESLIELMARRVLLLLGRSGCLQKDVLSSLAGRLDMIAQTGPGSAGSAEVISRAIQEALSVPSDVTLQNWQEQEWKTLADYLYGSSLVVHCQQSSDLVARETWSQVLACRLLRHSPLVGASSQIHA